MKKYYIATAIPYTSAKPHIGNTYEAILADVLARYKRSKGFDVFFQTGTDEHGEKIANKAEEEGITPKEYADKISGEIRKIWDLMNVSYDYFIRTTDEKHVEVVQKIFKKLYDQGDIYLGKYKGYYCTPCESFFTEKDLIDGNCPDCGRKASLKEEDAYFLKLSKYQDRLIEFLENNPHFAVPESRKNEMINTFLKEGLTDLCVSRTSFDWGVPVLFDPKHVVYVWIDALTNYITSIGYDPDKSLEEFNKIWPCDLHVVGKDVMRFHMIYWPIILMCLDLPMPKQIYGHPWLLMGSDKMSKSKGNIMYADDLVKIFGVDPVRYYLLSAMPYSTDGSISYELLIDTINSDLVNNMGNLVKRTITMARKYYDGKLNYKESSSKLDLELIDFINNTMSKHDAYIERFEVSKALKEIFYLFDRLNKYIDQTEPWVLAKENNPYLETVLYNLLEGIKVGASLLSIYLPETSKNILKQINMASSTSYSKDNTYLIEEEPAILFNRLDKEKMLKELC